MRPVLALLSLGLVMADAHAAIVVDGRLDEPEWENAQRFREFVAVQPLTGKPAPDDRRTEAWLLPTPEGIAVAIRAWHPADVPQTRARTQRDTGNQVDRLNFMIDFNADGKVAYDFTLTTAGDVTDEIITNENSFRTDWDGDWQHAVADFDGGYAGEWLIPWSIAPMTDSKGATRTIAVYFDRVIAATGERFAYPNASFLRPRFVSDFARVQIDQYQQSLLAVTPYAVALTDLRRDTNEFKIGADLFWKPNGDHQFAATINPDFGQVESDQLVVNFTALETFFTDKRPFFTENQGYFNIDHPLGNLFYTRRVGGNADDGSGAAGIDVAAKANGSVGRFGYGAFAAREDGAAGRDFLLLRGTHGSETLELGVTHTNVQRPFLQREADVDAIDARWRPTDKWIVRPLLLRSEVTQHGQRITGHGYGVVADWDLGNAWRQQYFLLRADDRLQLNDMGFQNRNDQRYIEWETGYRQDGLPAESYFGSHAWEFELVQQQTTAGLRLRESATVQRYSEQRNGGNQFFFLRWNRPAFDDRLSRGNGALRFSGGPQFFFEQSLPRQGDGRWGWYWNVESFPNVVAGRSIYGGVQPRYHLSERFDVDLGLYGWRQSDWLLWQSGREFGSFRTRRAELFSNLNWFIDDRQELRVKLQAIAIDAEAKQARRLLDDGRLVDSTAALEDFQLRNLGFQVRYRYKLGRLSDVYAVYSRGGFAIDDEQRDLRDTLQDAFALRDDDQFLIKIAYRFEPRW